MKRPLEKNILVVSDLHLGEDLRPPKVSYLRRIARLERELVAFLTYYRVHRIAGRPWRLVVNGDMVDFMYIQIMPEAGEASEDERQYGLGHGEAETLAKLERVIDRHRPVFAELAAFVAAGNELIVVTGNHDVEFHYPSVQRRMVEAIESLAPGVDRTLVRFCPWFYYEEEVVYVEHGHQYDDYCSFDYQLHPVEEDTGRVTLSMAHAGVRYFANQVPALDTEVTETWDMLHYVRWGWRQGTRGVARTFLFYTTLVRKLIAIWSKLTDRRLDRVRRERHRTELRALAARYRMAVDKLEALDALRRLPVVKSFGKILMTMFLDRILLGTLVLLAGVLAVVLGRGAWQLGGPLLVLGVGIGVNQLLSHWRLLDSKLLLRRVPEAIGKIVRAPFIVLGHSHYPEAVPLSGGATYFNTGTWLADDGQLGFTHLIIHGEENVSAELCQWRDGASAKIH